MRRSIRYSDLKQCPLPAIHYHMAASQSLENTNQAGKVRKKTVILTPPDSNLSLLTPMKFWERFVLYKQTWQNSVTNLFL